MTTTAVLVDPPRAGEVLEGVVETSPLTGAEAADLYAAMTRDVATAVDNSGGPVLVNYRSADAEAEIREVLDGVVDPDDEGVRFEVQVGETFAGRAGNTATHLLEAEAEGSVAITRPESAFLARTEIDGSAMKLRSSEVVLGPAPGGRVYFAAFTDPIDYADAFAVPAIETLTDRALDAGHEVDFLESKPVVETGRDLAAAITTVRTRRKAERIVPRHLAEWVADSELAVEADDGDLTLVR